MWTCKDSDNNRLCALIAEHIHNDQALSVIYHTGNKEACYRKMLTNLDSTISSMLRTYEETAQKLESMGLLPHQFPETFCTWIKEAESNPNPDDIYAYQDIVAEKFVDIYRDELEEVPCVLDFWGIEPVTEEDGLFREDMEQFVAYNIYQDVCDEVAELLRKG